jgi:hypothetical protein
MPASPPRYLFAALCATIGACSYDFDAPFDTKSGEEPPDAFVGEDAKTDRQLSDGQADAPSDVMDTDTTDDSASSDAAHDSQPDAPSPDAACEGPQKQCGDACVNIDDPAWGCTPVSCVPCVNAAPHAAVTCSNGSCALGPCESGWGNCDGVLSNGCETSTLSSEAHCGKCGEVCSLPHSSEACANGSCTIVSCNSSYMDCNGFEGDGCEADLDEPETCGSCSNACPIRPHAVTLCDAGACSFACSGNYEDCNGVALDGCEADVTSDKLNCEQCGNQCTVASVPHVVPTCEWPFGCLTACESGWGNCDADWTNGCECAM